MWKSSVYVAALSPANAEIIAFFGMFGTICENFLKTTSNPLLVVLASFLYGTSSALGPQIEFPSTAIAIPPPFV